MEIPLLGGLLLEAVLVVGLAKVGFEVDPGLVGGSCTVPALAVVEEQTSVKDETESGVEDLCFGLRLVTSVGIFLGVVNLLYQDFKWCVGAPRGLEWLAIVDELLGTDGAVGSEKVM